MTDTLIRQGLQRALNGLKMMLGRGRVLLTDDSGAVQSIQTIISAKETMNLSRLAEFGFASRVPENGDCAVIFLNAERTWGIIVATGHQSYRFHLDNDGEMAIHDAFGKSIWLKKTGGIVVDTNGQDLTMNMHGGNFIVNGAASVQLGGAAGKKVALDQDPVVANKVNASSTVVTGK